MIQFKNKLWIRQKNMQKLKRMQDSARQLHIINMARALKQKQPLDSISESESVFNDNNSDYDDIRSVNTECADDTFDSAAHGSHLNKLYTIIEDLKEQIVDLKEQIQCNNGTKKDDVDVEVVDAVEAVSVEVEVSPDAVEAVSVEVEVSPDAVEVVSPDAVEVAAPDAVEVPAPDAVEVPAPLSGYALFIIALNKRNAERNAIVNECE